jgi:hypothetical protein
VIHPAGGAIKGQVLVLDVGANRVAELREWLWQRENRPKRRCIKELCLAGLDHVFFIVLRHRIEHT